MNRLARESSPYLRQHANNPVDWHPWTDEAFSLASRDDKPVLLSVGYSSCHWCHVMAHESFEDAETAQLMNELFVNIKVDREERPDVDAIYMEAVQAMTGQGGWPMTVFLTPDRLPFFAGTYFPKESSYGRPGFKDVLQAIAQAWQEQRDGVREQSARLRDEIRIRTHSIPSGIDIEATGPDLLKNAYSSLEGTYDEEWGGFGAAPKFPQTSALELLLRSGDEPHLSMVTNSLDAMASGGIYDHIGGGFHRYSVDAFWMVPHFEKMLYDQAAFARIYLHAYQATDELRYRQVVEETIGYVLRDLAAPPGAWYCAEDADSEGEEGTFYVWRQEAIDAAIGSTQLAEAARNWYGVTKSGNFEGSNILHRPARGDLLRPSDVEEARMRLFEARQLRVRPALDDKILTEWVAMFIATLSEAGSALARSDWIETAEAAADFLLDTLRAPAPASDGRWLRAWQMDSGARHLAYANDYAWLVEAFTGLGEATGKARWRSVATATANEMRSLFWDEHEGGLFTTGNDAEQLIVRSKDLFDGAITSANSTAAVALLRLAALTGNDDYRRDAEAILRLVAEPMTHHPSAFMHFLTAVDTIANGASETVIAGAHSDLVQWIHRRYLPRNTLMWGERDASPLWIDRDDGAYVCHNQTCSLPITSVDGLAAQF